MRILPLLLSLPPQHSHIITGLEDHPAAFSLPRKQTQNYDEEAAAALSQRAEKACDEKLDVTVRPLLQLALGADIHILISTKLRF